MSPDSPEVAARLAQSEERRAKTPRPEAAKSRRKQGSALGLSDPEPWPEQVSGTVLALKLSSCFTRFIALPPYADVALVLWVLHTHAHDASDVSPILVLSSPEKRCGKTTTLGLLQRLVPRPLLASNISTAALFRVVEDAHPTLLVDEADSFLAEREELRGILNSGHLRTSARVVRTVGEDFEPRAFSTWAPKAIALIGRVPGTLEDRGIVLLLRRRAPHEVVERLRLDRGAEFEPLRQQAARWAKDNAAALRALDPEVPAQLHDRAADNWRPLLSIAERLGGDWPQRAGHAALVLSGEVDEAEAAPSVQLLADLRSVFGEKNADRLGSSEIVRDLTDREDRPWSEWKAGKPLTQTQLARLLKPFGVQPRTMRLGEGTARGYFREDLDDAFSRYLPPEAQHPQQGKGGAGGAPDSGCNGAGPVAPVEHTAEPLPEPLVSDVAGWGPVEGEGADGD